MKRVISLFILLLVTTIVTAQYDLSGIVIDQQGEVIPGAILQIEDTEFETFSDSYGKFFMQNVPKGTHVILTDFFGYESNRVNIEIDTNKEINIVMTPSPFQITPIEVISNWAHKDAPITQTNLDEEAIQRNNLGQDVPYLLKSTPSVVVTSDGGTGIGYTGIRLRGSDPTRVNVTINGIALNDTESQGVFWVDLPDFASSTNGIQIQRGVGTSVNGAGAFGGSINLNTNRINEKAYGSIATSIGSFDTQKMSVKGGTGLINDRFFFDGRYSFINSDGYVDRAASDLKSFYVSGGFLGKKNSLYVNVFSGHEITYQAWNGLPAQYIDTLPTFNTAGMEKAGTPHDNEVDDYTQTHYQLHYNHDIGTNWSFNGKLNYTKGKGFFEQYKAEEDLIDYNIVYSDSTLTDDLIRRRWLDNDFYGFNVGLNYRPLNKKYDAKIGFSRFNYVGQHFGEVIWTLAQGDVNPENYYDNEGRKKDEMLFAAANYNFTPKLNGYLDLQGRLVTYEFEGFDNEGILVDQEDQLFFFNPKIGFNYAVKQNQNLYAYFGIGNKEPNRNDYTESTPNSRPKHETLYNTELGYRYRSTLVNVGANLYYMGYKNQLALTGQLNDVGAATRVNIEDSYRAGIEVDAALKLKQGVYFSTALTLSQNKIKAFDEYIDNWDYWYQDFSLPEEDLDPLQFNVEHVDTDLSFSPNVIWSGEIGYDVMTPFDTDDISMDVSLLGKYVGKQFIDNTSNENTALDAYFYSDARISLSYNKGSLRNTRLTFLIRNLFDQQYITNAWTYRYISEGYDGRPDDPYTRLEQGSTYNLTGFYPQAGRNYLLGLEIGF